MSGELSIKVGEAQTYNEGSSSQFTSQPVTLVDQQDQVVARVDAYTDNGYYSAYWMATLPPDQLVALAEQVVTYYETHYPDGVQGVDSQNSITTGENLDKKDKDIVGIVYFAKNKETGKDDQHAELEYERPLSWDRIQSHAGEDTISFARLNTPIGDFCLTLADVGNFNFGFISHLAEVDGFTNLLEQSTEGSIGHDKATEFFAAMVALYTQS